MADTKLTIETINNLSLRLGKHTERLDDLLNVVTSWETVTLFDALTAIRDDVETAVQACRTLAGLRFAIAELADMALAHPEWENAVIARDLHELLDTGPESLPEDGRFTEN